MARYSPRTEVSECLEEEARDLFEEAQAKGIVTAGQCSLIRAACWNHACVDHGLPIKLDEVATLAGVNGKLLQSTYFRLVRRLGLKSVPKYGKYVPRFCHQLGLDDLFYDVKSLLVLLLPKVLYEGSPSPESVAAGAIYAYAKSTGTKITQRAFAEEVGVSEVSIRAHSATFSRFLNKK